MHYDKQNRMVEKFRTEIEGLEAEIKNLKEEKTQLSSKANHVEAILNSTLHEVRKFSAQLTWFSEQLSKDTEEQPQLNQTALSIFYTAGMISSRLAYTDIELNPRALENQTVIRSGIYKKFDKTKRILAKEARNQGVTIQLKGESRIEIDTLPVFELLPFVLLENGIKYSRRDESVTVSFETIGRRQLVTVISVGPDVASTELPRLFEKGYRGAQAASFPGDGLGLHLAKEVCRFHDIQIDVKIGRRDLYKVNGISYSEFQISLQF